MLRAQVKFYCSNPLAQQSVFHVFSKPIHSPKNAQVLFCVAIEIWMPSLNLEFR